MNLTQVHWVGLFLFVTCAAGYLSSDCSDYQCAIDRKLRKDCSVGENSRKNCLKNGCCFDNSIFNTTWCFYPLKLPEGVCPSKECQVIPSNRTACTTGKYSVVNPRECMKMGCCYDDDTNLSSPSCFNSLNLPYTGQTLGYNGFHIYRKKIFQLSCEVSQSKRRYCGSPKSTRKQCLRWKCCWTKTWFGGPHCYHPRIPRNLITLH